MADQQQLMNQTTAAFNRLRERERERFRKDRKGRIPTMDQETLRELCLEHDGYETPELNDNLYAHFCGFQKIEGLDAYYNLKALWLESNGLTRIENLSSLVQLRCLYLGKNLIEKIENLEPLQQLNTLDLSDNRIQTLSGLSKLPSLSSLNLSRNQLTSVHDLQELAKCASLSNLDISNNQVDDQADKVVHIFQQMPQLKALRITGNPLVSKTKFFRKVFIASLSQLCFLDRPIFPMERVAVAAWKQGGNEAELAAKKAFVARENDERRRSLQEFRLWQQEIREKKARELEAQRLQQEREQQELPNVPPAPALHQQAPPPPPAPLQQLDLGGFRGITAEEFARLDAKDKAVWQDRIARAKQDAQAELAMVLGDGTKEVAKKFWAHEEELQTRSEQEMPAITKIPESNAPVPAVSVSTPQAEVIRPPPAPVAAPVSKISASSTLKELKVDERSLAVDLTPTPPQLQKRQQQQQEPPEKTSTRPAPVEPQEPSQPPPSKQTPTSPALPIFHRDATKFFQEVGDERQSWSQLEERAHKAPFLQRPMALPSVQMDDDDGDDDDDDHEDDSEAAQEDKENNGGSKTNSGIRSNHQPSHARVHALTRDEILKELQLSTRHLTLTQLDALD